MVRKAAVGQPRSEKKQLDSAQNGRHDPELDDVSFGDFQDVKENLRDKHHDQDLPEGQIMAKKSPAPPGKTFTRARLVVKVGIVR